jgi:SWI/SNF-related matrix-associated actin-dependent regulator of chromatin subfamily A3
MSTKLFKAMKKLSAKYRWCLTGTPVQNSLEDFVALLSFIKASPLDDVHHFRRFIITPLMKREENSGDNLRKLLDSICLRRTKELLNLPHVIEDLQVLKFSAEEQQHYLWTRDKLIKLIKLNTLKPKSNRKGYLGVFQLQLQLRRLCNHGTFQKPAMGTEEFDPQQAMAHLKKSKLANCESCNVKITGIHGIEEKRSGNFTICGHLLCRKCESKLKAELEPSGKNEEYSKCPLCSKSILGNYMVNDENTSTSTKQGTRNLTAWQYFDKDGCSTKVSAVLADVERNRYTDEKA